ncbi:MAG TPA: hypothetical protein PLO06_10245 [Methanoregulaceae archaeon]|nr:hypothetical protein [Methanoregulaceae archaeon]HPD76422.1 hypothetical protein [Methanoregulaceae archaeon]
MNYRVFFLSIVLIVSFTALPASAFTAKSLDIVIDTNGNAEVSFAYELNLAEQALYFVVPGKEQIVTAAIGSKYPKVRVSDVKVGSGSSSLALDHFASVSKGMTETTYRTPAISFDVAGDMLEDYTEIARFILPDFSPDVTSVSFTDGKEFMYYDVDAIPSITYAIPV